MISFKSFLLLESSIPDTRYGFWVKPDGEVLPVLHYEHESVAFRQGFDEKGPGWSAKDNAMLKGWLHLVADNPANPGSGTGGDIHSKKLTLRSWLALKEIIRSYPADSYHITDYDAKPGNRHNTFDSLSGVMAYLQSIKPKAKTVV